MQVGRRNPSRMRQEGMRAKRKPQMSSGRVDPSTLPADGERPGFDTAFRRAMTGDKATQERAWNVLLGQSGIRVTRRGS